MAAADADATKAAPREIPAHDVEVFSPKAHRNALVIPVLNEGERIRGQLRSIAALRPRVDVVIADGGSTDGSVAADFLRQHRREGPSDKARAGPAFRAAAHGLRVVPR